MKRMLTVVLAVVLVAGSSLLLTQCGRGSHDHGGESAPQHEYFCPMHPQIVQDKPGNCPICSMKLERREKARAPSPGQTSMASGKRKILFYRHPMDPSIHSQTPAKDDMGMDYVPVYEDEVQGAPAVHGRVPVNLPPEKRQILGIRSEPVREADVDRTLGTVGTVAVDETHIHHHHAKFEGYVEKLYVSYTGQLVKKGAPLLAIYSPELLATQQEYLLAYKARQRFSQSTLPGVAQGGVDMLESTRRRLLLWDIREADVDRLEKTGEARRTLNLYAEVGGYVLEKAAFHGMRVTPTDTLFKIADLGHVWVLADVYEHQLPLARLGTAAEITTSSHPGRTWKGNVTFIAPTVEPATRTVKVRVEVPNPDGELKPDMFASVALHSGQGRSLVIPESAVIETGERQLVFVDRPDGILEPREVTLGTRTRGAIEVTAGVSAGERVVTSASFLLDSESSMKAAVSAMTAGAPTPTPAHGAHQ